MAKIEIYKEDILIISIEVNNYDITTYTTSFDIDCKIGEINISYSIPVNKGYKIIVTV